MDREGEGAGRVASDFEEALFALDRYIALSFLFFSLLQVFMRASFVLACIVVYPFEVINKASSLEYVGRRWTDCLGSYSSSLFTHCHYTVGKGSASLLPASYLQFPFLVCLICPLFCARVSTLGGFSPLFVTLRFPFRYIYEAAASC